MIDTALRDRARKNHESVESKLIREFAYFGRYLHASGGGNGGKPHLLALLYALGGSAEQREILGVSNIKSASLSEALSKLEAEGAITRTRLEDDRRSVKVELTEAGAQVAAEIVTSRIDFASKCFKPLTQDKKEELLGILTELHTTWSSLKKKEQTCEIEQ